MLELFLKLVDRVIQLQKHRLDNRKELFNSLVEPSFNEASSVYSDYRMMLRSAKDLMQQDDFDKAISQLESDRENYLATRTKLRAMAASIRPQDVDLDRAQQVDFADLLSMYVTEISELVLARAEHNVPHSADNTRVAYRFAQDVLGISFASSLLEHLSYVDPDNTDLSIMILVFDEMLAELDAKFQVVATLYGKLKAAAYLGD